MNTSTPLLRRKPRESIALDKRKTMNKRQLIVLVVVVIICMGLLGLLLFHLLPKMADPSISAYLVKDNFKDGKLSQEQLQSLAGMYYAKTPNPSELKALYDNGEKVGRLVSV